MSEETMQRKRNRSVAVLAVLAAVLLPAAEGPGADDTALFTSTASPNVTFIFDNSGSMNNVVWHPAFRPDVVYDPVGCPYIADPADPAYDPRCLEHPMCDIDTSDSDLSSGTGNSWLSVPGEIWYYTRNGKTATRCGNTRDIFTDDLVKTDGNSTAWTLEYLNWYFSDNVEEDPDGDGRTILQEILDPDDGVNSECLVDLGFPTNYAKYTRARVTAAKSIVRDVICRTNQVADIRYGLAKFYGSSGDPDGGYVTLGVDDYSTSHADDLENAIEAIEGDLYTPLAETLFNVYRYYMSRNASGTALGKDGTTRFPVYNIRTNGTIGTSSVPPSPVTGDCQQHFVVVLTDGEPTKDDFQDFDGTTQATFQDDLIGDFVNPGDEVETSGEGLYLDDVAGYMQAVDFLPGATFPGKQTVSVYTVGFTTNPTANDLLQRTAVAGNGLYFFSNNAEELSEALSGALSDIVARSKSFTAATVPASRATDGNNFFTSYFTPSTQDPYWTGHLKLLDFSAKGEVLDAPPPTGTGQCALNDPQAPARCKVGGLDLTLGGFWDAADQIPNAGLRNLYVSKYQTTGPTTIPELPPEFTEQGAAKLTPLDLGVSGATATDIARYDLGIEGFDVSGIDSDTELTDAIVRYIRGCEFSNSSTCTDRGDGRKLWDIFHSNPLVVGPPNSGLREGSYRSFVRRYGERKRVIYAGSNGGFVHGFNAGEFDTSLSPPAYDRGTGAEEFGFMAYPARQQIEKRPRDTWPRGVDGWNGFTMDGSPSAADVWFYEDANDDPDDADLNWENWRTVLLGGMRQGGRVVWALDVTDPDGISGDPTVYPGYLWEFPCERSSCDTWRPYMGETWSQPVITRVKTTVNCGDGTSAGACAAYDRWVAIFGAGYDESGDPNLPHDSDGTIVAGEYDPGTDADTKMAGRAVFMIDIKTGEVLAAKRFQHDGTAGDTSDGEPEMRFAFASAPSVFDVDFDGYADLVLIPDLGGNLWKWVIDEPGQDHVNGSQGSDQQTRWPFLKLLQAESCTTCSPKHYKSFYFPPTGAMVGPYLYLALGSGERNDLDFGQDGGLSTAEKNRFYVFKDVDPLELERDPADLPLTDDPSQFPAQFLDGAGITNFNPNQCLPNGEVGFYLEGEEGEKFITDSVIFFGVVFTSSYKPAPSTANACTASGDAFLYAFDLLCGEGGFPPSSGNPADPRERRIEVGDGLPSSPRVSVGPTNESSQGDAPGDPCKDMVIVITSENGGYGDGRCERQTTGVGLQTWRDL